MDKPRMVPVGKIVRAHGIRGAVKIFPYGESLMVMETGGGFFLQPDANAHPTELSFLSLRAQGKLLVAELEGLATRSEAEAMVGKEIFLPEDRLPPAEEGEYYHFQLIGLTVETTAGQVLGTVRGIIETGANDVYLIDCDGKEVLIPAIEDVICGIDLEQGKIVVDPPEGLLDDL